MKKCQLRLLFVEDEAGILRRFASAMELECGSGFTATMARDADDAAAFLQACAFDAVLFRLPPGDVQLDELVFRFGGAGPRTAAVVLARLDEEERAQRATSRGIDGVVFEHLVVDPQAAGRALWLAHDRHIVLQEHPEYAQAMSRQLDALERALERVAGGDLSARVAEDGGRVIHADFTRLCRTFDAAVSRLQGQLAMKAAFYSMVTHDLRSPLSTILLSAAALTDDVGDAQMRRELTEIVQRRSADLMGLVDTLLEVFSIDAGQLKLNVVSTDANELMDRCVRGVQRQAAERRQTLLIELLEGDPWLECDADKVHRVLENLISNAIKYSHRGDVIQVRAFEEGGCVVFEVLDNGPGIALDDHHRIFEPYVRLEPDSAAGSGIGLAICREFVNAHGGHIRVESRPGEGARFRFSIPRGEPREKRPALERPAVAAHNS